MTHTKKEQLLVVEGPRRHTRPWIVYTHKGKERPHKARLLLQRRQQQRGLGDSSRRPKTKAVVRDRISAMAAPTAEVMWRRCDLNPDGCLSLANVLRNFGAPISEEHAWAICHEAARTLGSCIGVNSIARLAVVRDAEELFLHKDGTVHPSSFIRPKTGAPRSKRPAIHSENKVGRSRGRHIATLFV